MSEYEEDFIPHTRDEQSEQPLDLLPFEDAPLEDALRRHYQLTARQSARTLEQARERIQQSRRIGSTQAPPSGNISQFCRTKNERTSHMFVNNSAPSRTSKFPRLSVIAAMLIATLVVGSMLWLVGVTHPFAGGTIVASRPGSSQMSSKPIVISGGGIVYPNQEQDIQYSTSVKVKAVFVKAGEQVKPGQVLMRIVSGRIISQIQLAQAKLQAAQLLLTQDTANGNTKSLTKDQQMVALAQSELNQLQQLVDAMQGNNVTSSIAGVVTQIKANVGQIVFAKTVLLTIMDESTVVVHAKVPLAFMSQVLKNQVATVTTSALSGRSFRGTVTTIPAVADPKTHTFEAWISVPNPTRQLQAGMNAQVQIQVK